MIRYSFCRKFRTSWRKCS